MKGFDLWAILSNPEFGAMLLHGVKLTLIVALASWLLAMTLALVLLAVRLAPSRIAQRGGAHHVACRAQPERQADEKGNHVAPERDIQRLGRGLP